MRLLDIFEEALSRVAHIKDRQARRRTSLVSASALQRA
jgi:hypothetical protein